VSAASSAPGPGWHGRHDPVVQLLGEIWDSALDPGYAAAAASSATGRRRAARLATVVGLVLIGLILAVALAQTRASAPAVARQRTELEARIAGQTSTYDRTTQQVAALQQQVDALKSRELADTGQGSALADRVAALELASGQVAVTGPAVQVTLDDAATAPPGTDPDVDRVLDRDLQSVVNGLWAAGAEAVAVNGQRLTAVSAIRSAGDAILVDYRPLTRPYVVVAIGDPASLPSRFSESAAGRGLQALATAYGIRSTVTSVGQQTLPAASPGDLRYARGTDQ
jgi:uncharacterized protein YlxW (UPF0749 family)